LLIFSIRVRELRGLPQYRFEVFAQVLSNRNVLAERQFLAPWTDEADGDFERLIFGH
jgi:hypothetical protein